MKKGAYFFVYLLPITVAVAFNLQGWYTFLPIIVFYGLVPLFELALPANHKNPSDIESRNDSTFYETFYSIVNRYQGCPNRDRNINMFIIDE